MRDELMRDELKVGRIDLRRIDWLPKKIKGEQTDFMILLISSDFT